MMRRFVLGGLALVAGALIAAPSSQAAPLADNCDRINGTVVCTTVDGPGKNQGGVGETTITETQGNTTNKSPEDQQDLDDVEFCRPPSSQGAPCNP